MSYTPNGRVVEYRDVRRKKGEVFILSRTIFRVFGRDFASVTEADAYGRTKARLIGERGFDIYRAIVGPDGRALGSRLARRVRL